MSNFQAALSDLCKAFDSHPQARERPSGYSRMYRGERDMGPFEAFHHLYCLTLDEIAHGDLTIEDYARGMMFAMQAFTLDGFRHGIAERAAYVNKAYAALGAAIAAGKEVIAARPVDAQDEDDDDVETWEMLHPYDRPDYN